MKNKNSESALTAAASGVFHGKMLCVTIAKGVTIEEDFLFVEEALNQEFGEDESEEFGDELDDDFFDHFDTAEATAPVEEPLPSLMSIYEGRPIAIAADVDEVYSIVDENIRVNETRLWQKLKRRLQLLKRVEETVHQFQGSRH